MAKLDPFRDLADPLWEQRIRGLEEGGQIEASAINAERLASEAVTGAKVVPAVLGSRTLGTWSFSIPEKTTSGKLYGLSTTKASPIVASEATKGVIEYAEQAPAFLRINSYAITGRTAKQAVEVVWATNAAEPAITFTFGFSKIASVAGAAKKLEVKVEAQSAEPSAEVATPGASLITTKQGTAGTALAAGQYIPTILFTTGTETAASSLISGTMSLILTYS